VQLLAQIHLLLSVTPTPAPSILVDRAARSHALAYYVETYDVALPAEFETHMQRNHWKVPDGIDTSAVELPPART